MFLHVVLHTVCILVKLRGYNSLSLVQEIGLNRKYYPGTPIVYGRYVQFFCIDCNGLQSQIFTTVPLITIKYLYLKF